MLGVTFKPESDDVRDSPALDVAVQLKGLGAEVIATDPEGIENARRRASAARLHDVDAARRCAAPTSSCSSPSGASTATLDPVETGQLVAEQRIIDGRNVLDAAAWRAAGWTYRGLGRP